MNKLFSEFCLFACAICCCCWLLLCLCACVSRRSYSMEKHYPKMGTESKEREIERQREAERKRGEVKRDSFEFSVYSHAQRTHILLIEQKTRTGFCRLFSFLPLSISLFLFNFFDSPLQNLEREWFRYMDPAFYISQSFLLYKNTNIYR